MNETASDLRAWKAATVGNPASWYHHLSTGCINLIDAKLRSWREYTSITELRISPAECSTLARELGAVRQALEEGRGFTILQGLSEERYSPEETRVAYWIIGQGLGIPLEQNVQGTLLYDVRDTGQDLAQGARFSVTNYESSFHTDNSFGDTVADVVGLLCLRTARAGGVSQIVSGHTVDQALRAGHAEARAVLSRPFHVDRRGGVRPGQAATVQRPVIEEDSQGLLFRYLRTWIEAGQQKAGVPLTPEQVAALDTLDGVLRKPELRVEFALRARDMLFLNNRWLLHNRTAFEDNPEPEQRRHLVRLWLRSA
jgi:hypothetical protein